MTLRDKLLRNKPYRIRGLLYELRWFRIRGWVIEHLYIWVTKQIYGPPKHDHDMVRGCWCNNSNCIAWRPVFTYLRLRSGLV